MTSLGAIGRECSPETTIAPSNELAVFSYLEGENARGENRRENLVVDVEDSEKKFIGAL